MPTVESIGSSQPACYLCGATDRLTRDHVPPRNLFPTPRPTNLITVDCCETCNNRMHLSDERMRVFLSAPAGRSQAGDQVWRDGVVGSSFNRSPALRQRFAISSTEILALRNGVISPHLAVTIPQDEARAYIVRITKGLLRHFYPDMDYSTHLFSIDHLEPSADNIGMLIARFPQDSRGEGVFRFFRQVNSDPPMGIWVYFFFDRACFMATHGSQEVVESFPILVSQNN
jgi:hypothetical protein